MTDNKTITSQKNMDQSSLEKSPPGTPVSVTSTGPKWAQEELKPKKTIWKKISSFLGHVAIIAFLAVYTAAGGIAFQALEQPQEALMRIEERQQYQDAWKDAVETIVDHGEHFRKAEEIKEPVKEKLLAFQAAVIKATEDDVDLDVDVNVEESESKWTFPAAFFFAATIVTTIGYGHIAPITFWGRFFCIGYALFGIPLTLIAIGSMGKLCAMPIKFLKKCCSRKKSSTEEDKPVSKHLSMTKTFLKVFGMILLLLVYIAIGAAIFITWEKWTYFEAFYFCFITMTTIGLGDFVPHHQMRMMLCTLYILLGLAITSTCIELARSEYEKSWQRMLEASRKLHDLSLADTFKKLHDQIETHGTIVDLNVMKDLQNAIKGFGTENGTTRNMEPKILIYESNV